MLWGGLAAPQLESRLPPRSPPLEAPRGFSASLGAALPLIETHGLTKVFRQPVKDPGLSGSVKHLVTRRYKDHVAVSGIDLAIEAGEAIAYVGPNGAGKSTTIKMLTGILV